MDDTPACADLCEEHGFAGPAAALRAFASGQGRFYFVRSLLDAEEAEFRGIDPASIALDVRKVFLDRGAAERYAKTLVVRALRSFAPRETYARNPSSATDSHYRYEAGRILGTDYVFPAKLGSPAFPKSATDDQLWSISKLFAFPLFDVVEFGDGPGRDRVGG